MALFTLVSNNWLGGYLSDEEKKKSLCLEYDAKGNKPNLWCIQKAAEIFDVTYCDTSPEALRLTIEEINRKFFECTDYSPILQKLGVAETSNPHRLTFVQDFYQEVHRQLSNPAVKKIDAPSDYTLLLLKTTDVMKIKQSRQPVFFGMYAAFFLIVLLITVGICFALALTGAVPLAAVIAWGILLIPQCVGGLLGGAAFLLAPNFYPGGEEKLQIQACDGIEKKLGIEATDVHFENGLERPSEESTMDDAPSLVTENSAEDPSTRNNGNAGFFPTYSKKESIPDARVLDPAKYPK